MSAWTSASLRSGSRFQHTSYDTCLQECISQVETSILCDIYSDDMRGLIQNEPRYATIINDTGDLKNMPQKQLEHYLLTASATVDGNKVTMPEDNRTEMRKFL